MTGSTVAGTTYITLHGVAHTLGTVLEEWKHDLRTHPFRTNFDAERSTEVFLGSLLVVVV